MMMMMMMMMMMHVTTRFFDAPVACQPNIIYQVKVAVQSNPKRCVDFGY